jgi:hypothetical protein
MFTLTLKMLAHCTKCWPTALEESLVACSFKHTERPLFVSPIKVLPQPGQATLYTRLLQDKGGSNYLCWN